MGHTTEVETVRFDCQKVLCLDCFELTEVGAAGKRVGVGGKEDERDSKFPPQFCGVRGSHRPLSKS